MNNNKSEIKSEGQKINESENWVTEIGIWMANLYMKAMVGLTDKISKISVSWL